MYLNTFLLQDKKKLVITFINNLSSFGTHKLPCQNTKYSQIN